MKYLLGQKLDPQISEIRLSPKQSRPPCIGEGLLQSLSLLLLPPPQVTVQLDHAVQLEKPPSTKNQEQQCKM